MFLLALLDLDHVIEKKALNAQPAEIVIASIRGEKIAESLSWMELEPPAIFWPFG